MPETPGETETYCKIVTAIKKSIEIQKEIDELYPLIEEGRLIERVAED